MSTQVEPPYTDEENILARSIEIMQGAGKLASWEGACQAFAERIAELEAELARIKAAGSEGLPQSPGMRQLESSKKSVVLPTFTDRLLAAQYILALEAKAACAEAQNAALRVERDASQQQSEVAAEARANAEAVIKECHEFLDEIGVPPCPAGTTCNNPKCNSKLGHRIRSLRERQGSRESEWISVQERLPEAHAKVEVLATSSVWNSNAGWKEWNYIIPTHWRPKAPPQQPPAEETEVQP